MRSFTMIRSQAGRGREDMDSELHEFLQGGHLLSYQTAEWGTSDAPYPVELRWYACDSPAPERFVVSIRAVVFRDDEVLVITDEGGGRFIVPGGHRRGGETFEDTVVREVLEECGWRIRPIRLFAGLHIHARGAPRADHRYPHPDSMHLAYVARAVERAEEWIRDDDWVVDSAFVPLDSAFRMELDDGQHELLRLARTGMEAADETHGSPEP